MADYWDNLEILRAIDSWQQETYKGGPLQGINGLNLMQRVIGASHQVDRMRGLIQELHICAAAELLEFVIRHDPYRPNLADTDPSQYLQALSDFALTVEGQDRARGRMIARPEPQPGEDDGRPISDLILREVAAAIADQYADDDRVTLLTEEGLPPAAMIMPEGADHTDVHLVLAAVWRWGDLGRQAVRRFLGRWLDNLMLTGPDAELRARLLEQLARQGWALRPEDSMLIIAEPARGIPVSAPFLRTTRLHPLVESAARDQFLAGKPDMGVFASMKAVEIRVRKLARYGNDAYGTDLMNKAFGPNGPLTDPVQLRGEQDATRCLFTGAYGVLRNPAGHREIDYTDISEASEAVHTASLLMRILDRVEDRLLSSLASLGAPPPGP
jgi:uncharacterized protein (TIGR02391 family)